MLLGLPSLAWPAVAGNDWNSTSREPAHGYYFRSGPSINSANAMASLLRGGTYSRTGWVINRKRPGAEREPVLAPKATIIHGNRGLVPDQLNDACAYEAGVCVIRAGN